MKIKAEIEFNGEDDLKRYREHLNGPKYRDILRDLDQWLRAKHKYTNDPMVHAWDVRDYITRLFKDEGLHLYD